MSTARYTKAFLHASLILQLAFTANAIGVNYGTLANNLPSPAQVVDFLKTKTRFINRIKIFDANPEVLRSFANTSFYLTVTIGNTDIPKFTQLPVARQWVAANVAPFYPQTKIIRVVVGNEILQSGIKELIDNLLPAMKIVNQALVEGGFGKIKVSTPHTLGFLEASQPPSEGRFKVGYDKQIIAPMLQFLRETKSVFMVNLYPFFVYAPEIANYTLFKPNPGVHDQYTNLTYTNMFDAMLDSVYSAMKKLGYADVPIVIAETGWASLGDQDQPACNMEYAATFNRNLFKHVSFKKGTPLMPNRLFETYIFALFNENEKTGPTAERNFGLFKPDMTPVYDIGLTLPGGPKPTPTPTAPTPPTTTSGNKYCVPKPNVDDKSLQNNIDYACSNGVNCGPIQPGGACFEPNTVQSHAAFVMNSYYKSKGQHDTDCDFSKTGVLTNDTSSYSQCVYGPQPPRTPAPTPTPPTLTPTPIPPPTTTGNQYCVPKPNTDDKSLQNNIDYACNNGVDCGPIQPSGSCFEPDTLQSHAAFAMNSFYKSKGQHDTDCDFSKTGIITSDTSGYNQCVYGSQPPATPTPTPRPPTLTPTPIPPPTTPGNQYCVPKPNTDDKSLQNNIDYACNNGVDCGPIQPGGSCFEPNTLQSHAAFAMNSFYKSKGQHNTDCDFSKTGVITSDTSGYNKCVYGSQPPATPTPTPTPPTLTPTPIPPPTTPGNQYCVPKPNSDDKSLQNNIDYACNNGVDCGPIQPGGSCFEPNTLQSHAAFAMNSYYKSKGQHDTDCDFSKTGVITSNTSSYNPCVYGSQPPTTPTPIPTPTPPSLMPTAPPTTSSHQYCVPKPNTDDISLQNNIDYACNNGVDCRPIQPGGACFEPNSLQSHAAFAMNFYYTLKGQHDTDCDFSKTGLVTDDTTGYNQCVYGSQPPVSPKPTLAPPTQSPTPHIITDSQYCVPKPNIDNNSLQNNIDYACSNGVSCGPIQPGGDCFEPNNLQSHAAFAMNCYYKLKGQHYEDCDFSDTGFVTNDPFDYNQCVYSFQPPPTPAPTPMPTPTPTPPGKFCVPKTNTDDKSLQSNIDYVCQMGVDCGPIQPGGVCFEPNTLQFHAAFAMNTFYKLRGKHDDDCDFSKTGVISNRNPSHDKCIF